MDAVIYLIWVSIPAILLLFASLVKLRQYLVPRESDNPQQPGNLLRAANLFALYGVVALIIDQYVLREFVGPGKLLPNLSADQTRVLRWALLPAFALLGFISSTMRRLLNPPAAFDRLRIEVKGSNPSLLFVAFFLFGAILLERDMRAGATWRPSSQQSAEKEDSGKQVTMIGRLASNVRGLAREVRIMLGLEVSPPPEVNLGRERAPLIPLPIYNPEGSMKFLPILRKIAANNKVDPFLVQAVIEVASGFNEGWEGQDDRKGLMGLSAEIREKQKVRNPLNGYQNIDAGSRHLRYLLETFNGDIRLALAAFYGGEKAVSRGDDLTDSPALVEFVDRVISIHEIIKARDGRL